MATKLIIKFGKRSTSVISYTEKLIMKMKLVNRISNAKIYSEVLAILKKLCSSGVTFEDITVPFLNDMEIYLRRRGLGGNTMSKHFRTLRAIYNRAISEGYIKADLYPFKTPMNHRGYNVSALEVTTEKRALSERDLQKLIDYQPQSNCEDLAKDVFIISLYLQGISFGDLCKLRYENIRDGRVIYYRQKTRNKARISIQMTKVMVDIIEKYKDATSPYLMPVLGLFHQTEQQKINRIHKKLGYVNQGLKSIARSVRISQNISTYCARHSYATLLKRKGVSVGIISQALGHTSEQTTQIYLDSFSNDEVDKANELLP